MTAKRTRMRTRSGVGADRYRRLQNEIGNWARADARLRRPTVRFDADERRTIDIRPESVEAACRRFLGYMTAPEPPSELGRLPNAVNDALTRTRKRHTAASPLRAGRKRQPSRTIIGPRRRGRGRQDFLMLCKSGAEATHGTLSAKG
jgi:hypothetical protein